MQEPVITTSLILLIVLAPLVGSIIAGLFGKQVGRAGAAGATILGVAVSLIGSLYVLRLIAFDGHPVVNTDLYTWFQIGDIRAAVGFLIDPLSAMMMCVVTSVSLAVHVYTIGYMREDPGFSRFFSYIALFTFAMLMLVTSNNFLQLFFGWEAVGLVSYLLIGFWYQRPTAIFANMKAFLVNRVGDFGFLLGIAAVLMYLGTLDYQTAFAKADLLVGKQFFPFGEGWSIDVPTMICVLLFIGAMGKSAQVPLHVWLPDSMEGPTPISALIHAATMVTAGIFMVARMSPLYELSEAALSFVLVIGATTAFFMGLIGMVQNDIKRVVAYSTLSQLGYMTVALGVSAYSVGVFHLMTHAFFKALLFLGAGSVIMGMHHLQDMRVMGGLRKYMPITFVTAWIGTLALTGFPGTSGFFSKDLIIEAVGASERAGATYAYWCVLLGVAVTSFYSFRLLYLTFHGPERFSAALKQAHEEHAHHGDDHGHDDHGHEAHDDHHDPVPHESPWVVTVPLILLAVPSLLIGWLTVEAMVFGNFFGSAIVVHEAHNVIDELKTHFTSPGGFALHGFVTPAFWLAVLGFAAATYLYLFNPALAERLSQVFAPIRRVLERKYGFDDFNQAVFAKGSILLGKIFWRAGDQTLIDGLAVNGSAQTVGRAAYLIRRVQSGYLYHYAFSMIVGLIVLVGVFVWMGR